MNINKQVSRAFKLFMVCICLQIVANCASSIGLIVRVLPPELTVSEVVDAA
jgi:hypothetical protein